MIAIPKVLVLEEKEFPFWDDFVSNHPDSSIYHLVVNTYKVTLVAAFVPLCAGLFWKGATTRGALCAIVVGLVAWLGLEIFGSEQSIWPPQLVGLFMAGLGMLVGSQLSPDPNIRS